MADGSAPVAVPMTIAAVATLQKAGGKSGLRSTPKAAWRRNAGIDRDPGRPREAKARLRLCARP